jgi:transcriptional regulator with XRE-family HTH domain
MPNYSQEIGERIKQARQTRGLSPEELAQAMGRRSRKWTWELESGRKVLAVDELPTLTRILRRSISWIVLGREDQHGDLLDEERVAAGLSRDLPPRFRTAWLQSGEALLALAEDSELPPLGSGATETLVADVSSG